MPERSLAAAKERACPNPNCRDGWVPFEPNESGGAPPVACLHPDCPSRTARASAVPASANNRDGSRWVIRDDIPAGECLCHMPLLCSDFPHSKWCPAVRRPAATCYYAGRDLEGHWWMDRARAATFAYRDAQRFVRELRHPRRLTLEREAVERVAA